MRAHNQLKGPIVLVWDSLRTHLMPQMEDFEPPRTPGARATDGHDGFIDQTKHPSWWSDTPRAAVGDRMRAVVLDATRNPPRFSALPSDIRTARTLRHTEPLVRLCRPPSDGSRTVKRAAVKEALGIALAADYKRLVQTHGGGLFAGVLSLLEPGCPDAMYDLVAQTAEGEEIVAELWDAGEEKPSELHEGNARLAPRGHRRLAPHPRTQAVVVVGGVWAGRWPFRRRLTIWSITASPGGSRRTAAR
ncbi:hypothetical protein [Streptomyces sp. NBC_01669]|uniref:hypothetical protein n=1 Tax=Streptomyces sp. NBC_01669 TaxID=2975909 RepID=UPI00225150A8|nr:hypothetical protein [Streptomyces sp. NBC_01669]MCX4538473.1 hypothetical protein [Streptomyces sp. NBC_01669]